MQSLMATNDVCTLPVYRPLIGFDKQEIVDISEKIGTYETSILPYEDCCTIFVAARNRLISGLADPNLPAATDESTPPDIPTTTFFFDILFSPAENSNTLPLLLLHLQ